MPRRLDLVRRFLDAGLSTVSLADTAGHGTPDQVERLFSAVMALGPLVECACHLHDTYGLGMANAYAAMRVGVKYFEAAFGGLGGCPFAPGASGNVITEDLVFMFESMGVATGINLEALFKARAILTQAIPEEPIYGHTPLAGLPKGFRAAA